MRLYRSIPEALGHAASQGRADCGFTFVGDRTEKFCSFAELADTVSRFAAALLRAGLQRGDRVALALPDNEEFVVALLGAMHAGLVPTPMYPPQGFRKLGLYLDQARHILRASGSAMLITSPQIKAVLGSLMTETLRFICAFEDLAIDDTRVPPVRLGPDDPAFIQFTSGSTSRPKGVLLTHGNLTANAQCISHGLRLNSEDVGCAWLPLYHDMGLIGFVLTPILNCIPVVLISSYTFLKHPVEWFRRMTSYRATISFAPNFGYELCTARIHERDEATLDLSHWRVAGCGAEPIQIATLERFSDRFKSIGFSASSFILAYGLAENTLAVSFSSLGRPPRSERVRLEILTRGETVRTADIADASALMVANCGSSFPGHEVAVLNEDNQPCRPRQIGEIATRGPSVMRGYYNDSEATNSAIKDGWLLTGDLGFLSGGELFVCGRIKDLIILSGRNYHPADIEWIVSGLPGIRTGRAVAFGVCEPGKGGTAERLVICAESKTNADRRAELAGLVRARIFDTLGLKADVVLLDRNTLPRTSSGKLQRTKTRDLYRSGRLKTASANDGKLTLAWHLVMSRWGFLKRRIASVVTRMNRKQRGQVLAVGGKGGNDEQQRQYR